MQIVLKALEDRKEYSKILTEYTYELKDRSDESKQADFASMRNMPLEAVKEADIFYIKEEAEMMIPTYIKYLESLGVISETNKRPIFHNRYVIPIKDEEGNILNLVGYSRDADERYIYGTAKYYRRRDTLYGLENLELAYKLGYAIVTEGITDAIRLRSLGYKNSFARCGTQASFIMDTMMNRCKHGVIHVPDRDTPGRKACETWDNLRYARLWVFNAYKDVDEMCRVSESNCETFKEFMNMCIDWVKQDEHNGMKKAPDKFVILGI